MGRLIGTSTQYTFLPGHNFQNSNSYDAASNRTGLTAPDGSTNSYNYDTLNRLTTLTNSLTGQFGFGYDALSRRTQLTRPNGVNTNYNYDSVSHLLSVLHQAGSTTLDGASYGGARPEFAEGTTPATGRARPTISTGSRRITATTRSTTCSRYPRVVVPRRAILTMRSGIDCHHPACRPIATTRRTS